jgi:hypothetical protein
LRRSAGNRAFPKRLAACLLLVLLTSCGGPEGRRIDPPYQVSGPVCLDLLARRGVLATPWPAPYEGRSCRVDTPIVTPVGRTVRFTPALRTSCAMLLAWTDLEADMQRLASRHLRSQVVGIRHFGSYSCRGMSGNAGRLSLHARGRALDVAGFDLADGRTISVLDGWRAGRAQRRFLRGLRDVACDRYAAILSPDHDRAHRNHLHIDLGGWALCD